MEIDKCAIGNHLFNLTALHIAAMCLVNVFHQTISIDHVIKAKQV